MILRRSVKCTDRCGSGATRDRESLLPFMMKPALRSVGGKQCPVHDSPATMEPSTVRLSPVVRRRDPWRTTPTNSLARPRRCGSSTRDCRKPWSSPHDELADDLQDRLCAQLCAGCAWSGVLTGNSSSRPSSRFPLESSADLRRKLEWRIANFRLAHAAVAAPDAGLSALRVTRS